MRRLLIARLERSLNSAVRSLHPLGGGCISNTYRATLADGRRLAVKCGAGQFLLEARMLEDLRQALVRQALAPCPEVLYADADMLVLAWVAHEPLAANGQGGKEAARDAARVVARLHQHRAPSQSSSSSSSSSSSFFGYAYDTPLGNLIQDNRANASWVAFYREQRLLPLVRACMKEGQLDPELAHAIEDLPLEDLLAHRDGVRPALLHGDLWGGNMLFSKNRLAALIDPALYYGDPQIDCAMLKLFPALSDDFFACYREAVASRLSREEEQLCDDLYALYPLLVHCLLFGRRYNASLARVLHRYRQNK